MSTRPHGLLRRFLRSEDGNATIEFVITFPAMLFLLLSAVELAFVTLDHAMLERAMDMTVREIRIGTGTAPQHDQIKADICALAVTIKNCDQNLRLEMIQVDPRNWTSLPGTPDCTDQSKPVAPVRSFVNGQENQLMILRACVKVTPLFPTVGLGSSMVKDAAGQYSLVAVAAFVQEPR